MNNDDIHNLFIETVLKAKDNPVSDHIHSISPPNYGQHTHSLNPDRLYGYPLYYDPSVPAGKIYAMNGGNIYANPNDFNTTTTKEPKMSTIDKIRDERKEKREREELEAKFEAWDAAIGSAAEGDIYGFSVDMSNKTYRYAAIYVDKRWHLTGQMTCAMPTEDFIAWLIGHNAELQNMIFMEPLT